MSSSQKDQKKQSVDDFEEMMSRMKKQSDQIDRVLSRCSVQKGGTKQYLMILLPILLAVFAIHYQQAGQIYSQQLKQDTYCDRQSGQISQQLQKVLVEIGKQNKSEQVEEINKKIESILVQIEKQNNMLVQIEKQNDILYQKYNQIIKQIVMMQQNQQDQLKIQNDDWMDQIEYYQQQQQEQQIDIVQQVLEEHSKNRLQEVSSLEQVDDYVVFYDGNRNVEEEKKKIQTLEKKGTKYRIEIDFSQDTNLQWKMNVIKSTSQLDVNNKVGWVTIKLSNNNVINDQVIKLINNKYQNIYGVIVQDENNDVDSRLHGLIQKLVDRYLVLMEFRLGFEKGSLQYSDESLQLIKQYNRIMSKKKHLKYLEYYSSNIDMYGDSKGSVQQMINEIEQM